MKSANRWSPPAQRFRALRPGKARPGVQCPLPAEGPHRWAPGLLLGRARPEAPPHTYGFPLALPASLPSHGFQSAQCPDTSRLGSSGAAEQLCPSKGVPSSGQAAEDSGSPSGKKPRGRGLHNLTLRFLKIQDLTAAHPLKLLLRHLNSLSSVCVRRSQIIQTTLKMLNLLCSPPYSHPHPPFYMLF